MKHQSRGTQTYGDDIGAVVVEDCLDFQLLSSDSRVRQPQINEEFFPNNYRQRIANTDSFNM